MNSRYYDMCFKVPCDKCVYRDFNQKPTFFNKYPCKLNKKLQKNTCFYFKCVGNNNTMCERCNYMNKKDDVK